MYFPLPGLLFVRLEWVLHVCRYGEMQQPVDTKNQAASSKWLYGSVVKFQGMNTSSLSVNEEGSQRPSIQTKICTNLLESLIFTSKVQRNHYGLNFPMKLALWNGARLKATSCYSILPSEHPCWTTCRQRRRRRTRTWDPGQTKQQKSNGRRFGTESLG